MSMNGDQFLLHIDANYFSGSYEFFLAVKNRISDTIAFPDPIVMRSQKSDCATIREPLLKIPLDDKSCLITLMDDLWNIGIRPTNVSYKDDTIKAKDDHLKDMRTIAFHKLGINHDK